jgi:hypothetical protein
VVVFEANVAADGGGYAEALRLATRHAPGRRAFAIEGTASYGAGLSRFLLAHNERVFEVGRPRESAARAARPTRSMRSARRAASSRRSVRRCRGARANGRH